MENEEAKTIANNSIAQPFTDSSLTRSNSPPRDAKSSSPSSLSSDLSHGSSPREEKPPVPVVKRYVPVVVTKVDPEGGGRWRVRQSLSFLRRVKRESMVKKAALGFRVFGVVFCLISFSLMAADRYKGWALDSFDRYKEFRYCLSVNVIGFVYNLAQALDLAHHLLTGKYFSQHPLRYYFDFAMDQILTYLLMSASSSAATRVEDWESNWGNDKFTVMASASVGLSFTAFVAFAASSLISGTATEILMSAYGEMHGSCGSSLSVLLYYHTAVMIAS
ncbi:CASP-like protein [Actinidia chinensis var. chinensis]|uniref:CASP-like protein n=1 Tax=Actinidia chinensis var. chinensis TaxID=1590841 RepID=A0A2R6RK36_ACTCC|nr:CASP-like protein [Actinidia chinensis var. chinensis]